MSSKDCPSCGLINSASALRCDCGYDFSSGKIKDSYLNRQSRTEAVTVVPGEQLATSTNRLVNFIMDAVLHVAVMLIIITLFPEQVISRGRFFFLLLPVLYYILFEAIFQKTPAKFITRTRVVMVDGSKPPVGVIVVRTLCRYIPFEPFSGKKETWWHDRLSETRVIMDKKQPL